MNDSLALVVGVLAQEQNRGPDFGKASPVGFVIVLLLLIGTGLLIWSMNKHLRKLPESFDQDNPKPDQATDEGTVGLEPDKAPDNGGSPREPGG